MTILVTGGAGYIGSHTIRKLIEENHEIIILDNLSRGHKESIPDNVKFYQTDIIDFDSVNNIFLENSIDSVIHFAAFAYVGESVTNPSLYYQNNVVGSFNLLKAIAENNVKHIVFSSTCSLYGNPTQIPITEDLPTAPINPYANTKLIIEKMLADFEMAYGLKYIALRYFNAAGASMNYEIGESHNPEPHLIPIVLQTALGNRESISIFGDDYKTPDGTCVRDYIHVDDLADAHFKAVQYLEKNNKCEIINLGTGKGNSVKEIIQTAEEITGKRIETIMDKRRDGDPAVLIANNNRATNLLNWVPQYGIKEIIESAWNWHSNQKY